MKKRIMSMLLVVLMAISLLPAAALAVDDSTPLPKETDSLYLGKSYDPTTGMLTLETYAKGETITVETVQPCDIALVLDVSGSMDEWIKVGSFSGSDTAQLDPVRGAEEGFYRVDTSFWLLPLGERPLRFHNGKWQYQRDIHLFTDGWTDVGSNVFGMNSVTVKRINAMKVAADRFIDTVQANAEANDVDHKISIIKFASNYSDAVGNDRPSGENRSQIVKNLTTVKTTQQASELKNALTPIVEGGATRADYGMLHAKNVLTAANDPERGKVVVFMTDGTPTDRTNFNVTVANGAVGYAKDLKDIGTLVYSVGIFDEDPGTQINRFMNAVSSNTPGATSYTQGSSSQNAGKYYMTASTANRLEEIFKSIAEDIGGSFIDLNEQSTVVDQMSTYFKLDGVTAADTSKVKVYTADCIGADADGKFVFSSALTPFNDATITVTDGDTVNVSGFDFSENWVGKDGSNNYRGKKLVITFPVLPKADAEGKVPTNSTESGVYDKDGKKVEEYPVPQYTPATVSKVIDFNAKVNLANGVGQLGDQTRKNGEFALDAGTLSYQFNHDTALRSGDVSLVMDGVDSAMTFTSNVWTKYNAIPANNIYFDDDLVNHAALTYDDGSGYNAGVTATVSEGATALDDGGNAETNTGKVYYFTFKGTGIDVYCSTDSDSGYVQSAIVTDKADLKGTLVKGTFKAVNCYSAHNFNNVPTVFYDGLDPNTEYTLYLKVLKGANFKLDGVRVYNTMGADESVYNDVPAEKNAQFVNLRDNLINDGEDVTFNPNDDATQVDQDYLVGLAEDAKGNLTKVLFVDEPEKIMKKQTVKASNGLPITGEDGNPVLVDAYQNAYEAYSKIGAKNEIYLDKGQAIIFNISSAAKGDHYWVGLSAPEAGTGKVLLNQVPTDVVSPVDMYYDVTVDTDGNVTIQNNSDSVIAVTNLKVTSADGSKAVTFGAITPKLLKMASGATAAQTADSTVSDGDQGSAGSSIGDLIRQIISSFVQQLFSSISRMFGK